MHALTQESGLRFGLLTSGSVRAEVLPWTICLLTLVLIAQAVFHLKHGQTESVTVTVFVTV